MIQTELDFEQKKEIMLSEVLPYFANAIKTQIQDEEGLKLFAAQLSDQIQNGQIWTSKELKQFIKVESEDNFSAQNEFTKELFSMVQKYDESV